MYKNIFVSHIILLLLIAFCGLGNSFLYSLLKMEGLYEKVILTVLFIFILFTFIFYKYKETLSQYINDKFYIIVILSVLLVCIIELILVALYQSFTLTLLQNSVRMEKHKLFHLLSYVQSLLRNPNLAR